MKPKPQYDEIHLEYYDKNEMDAYIEEIRDDLIEYFREQVNFYPLSSDDVEQVLENYFSGEHD